ncbi:GMC family oxidoreductase N-terminal domain-containing protein [Microbacterium betulae]|uniref:GMC family oxidoreductase N-terminal domain-containing protein n=1 Tax=Microbacterium betulae TaxID=2981139 RepID=A0AA97FGC1_9MICO|nr:GMC family oxidoreductase N-terminal domain-containing protein [Microbacterium sp. AB]WOF22976.1 GMC family oxidoreductase N-terminal domain-containing protein [Microbacterium sp. AB]
MLTSDPGALAASYDYLVVGGGTAGDVLAARLSEDTDARVLLLEAGGAHHGVGAIRDATRWTSLLRGEHDWGYDYEPSERVNGRVLGIPRGRVLGGSSSVNAMLWYRGNRRDYDLWGENGATGWDFDALLPYFRLSEDWEGGANAYRGAGGPMRVETSKRPHAVAAAMLEAAPSVGIPVIDDPNAEDNEGAALANMNGLTRPGLPMERWSTARGYLDPALARPNLAVLTDAEVRRVVWRGSRAVGVVFSSGGRDVAVAADRGVVLTAGAIGTPRILWHSGVGDPEELAAVGLPTRLALRGVGRNYMDHPLLQGLSFRFRGDMGPLTDNGGGTMMNWRSSVADGRPDLHAFVAQTGQATPAVRERFPLGDEPAFAVSPGLMSARSVGWMRLVSPDPAVAPLIQPNFLDHPDDMTALVEAIDVVFDLLDAPAYRAVSDGALTPDRRLDAKEREEYVRDSVETFFHSSGTAKMGVDEMAVVDPSLRVHGADALWVADASVIPTLPTANTQACVVAVAERAAELIDGRSRIGTA